MSKPAIEAIINTAAIALSSYGVIEITTKQNYLGFLFILFGIIIETYKYYGRKKIW